MKRILLFSALLATASLSFAQWKNNGNNGGVYGGSGNNGQNGYYNNSALILNTASNEMFSVRIDNGPLYQSTRSQVSIPEMPVGNHTVTVYEFRRSIFGGTRPRVLYSATIYFKPGVEHSVYINQYGQASFNERALYQSGGYGNNGNGNGWGYGRKKDKHRNHGCDNDRNDRRHDRDRDDD